MKCDNSCGDETRYRIPVVRPAAKIRNGAKHQFPSLAVQVVCMKRWRLALTSHRPLGCC